MAKSFYIDRLGIRVEGHRNVTEARKAWEAERDHFVDRATACEPWIFVWRGHVTIVQVKPHRDTWSYSIVGPGTSEGRHHPSCYYGASSQIAAIAVALGALAQHAWTRDVADDAAFFDELLIAARVTAHEARGERDNFLHVAAHWRAHQAASVLAGEG
jgi:hypothetical protein